MKKPLFTLVLLLVSCGFAQADNSVIDAQSALKQKLARISSFSALFTQIVTDVEGNVLQEATGSLMLKQPDKLYWEVDEPNENILIADGQTLWHLDPFVEQVVATSQHTATANNPIVLLTSPESDAWSQFQVLSESADTFVIMATSETSHIAALSISFEGDGFSALQFIDRQQQVSHLTFSDAKHNPELAETQFQFTLPEGFDLDDQRN